MKIIWVCIPYVIVGVIALCLYKAWQANEVRDYNNQGVQLAAEGRYKEAIASYKKAIEVKPDDADVHYNMGIVHFELKQYKEALAACKEAVRLKSDHGGAHYNMGVIYCELKEYSQAISALETSIARDPKGKHADDARKGIDKIRKEQRL